MTYVIGDVHGSFNTLKSLMNNFSTTDTIILVGDLIDRGWSSRQTVKYVREKEYKTILGNHELMMINYGSLFLKNYPNDIDCDELFFWLDSGGKETLYSYELIELVNDKIICSKDSQYLDDFISDLNWMKTLPLYLEVEQKINDKNIVISHSCISNVWDKRYDDNFKEMLEKFILWDREIPEKNYEIFNIFGHTKVKHAVIHDNYINIDTGCYSVHYKYGKLTALCLENQEIISIIRDPED